MELDVIDLVGGLAHLIQQAHPEIPVEEDAGKFLVSVTGYCFDTLVDIRTQDTSAIVWYFLG